jgi:hypothetical protein
LAQPVRFAMLEAVAFSDMSASARAVYMALHVLARDRGVIEESRESLARALRLGERDLRYRFAELRARGYLRISRGKLELGWAESGKILPEACDRTGKGLPERRQNIAASEARIKNVGSIQGLQVDRLTFTRCSCGNPFDGLEPARCECGRVHYPEQAEALEALPAAAELLHGFVRSAGLGWAVPDEKVCADVLAASGGVAGLAALLRGLFARRLHPKMSYAWFIQVANQRRTA